MTLRSILTLAVVLVVTATPVYAEVMDKEPTITAIWAWALLGGALSVLAWRWRWWFGAIVSMVVLSGTYGVYLEISDPFVGPAIRKEAGQGYIGQFYFSALLGCVLQLFAVYSGMKVRRASR